MIFKQSKKEDGDVENTENLESNHQNHTKHMLVVPEGYITTEEYKKTINIVCNFIQMNLTSTNVQVILQLCARLNRVHAIALCFLERVRNLTRYCSYFKSKYKWKVESSYFYLKLSSCYLKISLVELKVIFLFDPYHVIPIEKV